MKKHTGRKISKRKQEEIEKRKKKRRKMRFILVMEIVAFCILGAIAFGMFKLDKLNITFLDKNKIVNNGIKQERYLNIALFGTDNREGETSGVRSDCIMVASIDNNSKKVRLLSVYRDTLLQQDEGHYDKANSAYATGGPEAAINMLNRNLDLDIADYISVNFLSLADVVDLLGGIEVEMTYEEVCHMNNYCVETSEITGKDYNAIEPEKAGTYKLNGVQAVSYARIRYTSGGDFERTNRQRVVIEKLVEKAKKADLGTLNKIIDKVLPEVSTSFSAKDILSMASEMISYSIGESAGFPFESETPEKIPGYTGSYVVVVGLQENVDQVHKFLMPNNDYETSEKVKSISEELSYMTGIYSNKMAEEEADEGQ